MTFLKAGMTVAAALAVAVAGRPADAQSLPGDTVVSQWNELTVQNIIATTGAPTVASRALAEVATAMYDAWTAYDPLANPTQPHPAGYRQPAASISDANKAEALSYAAYRVELDLFPSRAGAATALLSGLGYDPGNTAQDSSPAGIGNAAAAAVIAFRHNDGANQLGTLSASGTPYSDYSGYVPVNTPYVINDPNSWQPLAVPTAAGVINVQKYVTPFWAAVTPFATLPAFSGTGPARYPSPQYWFDSEIVLAYSAALNDTSKTIAEYWADLGGTQLPPGHWSRIAEFVSRRDQHGIDADAKMFFVVNNALQDAAISCGGVKRTFNGERPITAIHYLFTGKPVFAWAGPGRGARWIDGGSWVPYQPATVVTPAFPEYTSGHSTFSAAAATVLANFTGSDAFGGSVTFQPGSSIVEPGITPSQPVTLSWRTFSDAAKQAGLSRRYGGIHFIAGDLNGRVDGRLVGWTDWQQALTYFNGSTAGGPARQGKGWGWWVGGDDWGGDR